MKTLIAPMTALLLAAAPASATVIDFEDQALGYAGSSLTIGEATFTAPTIYLADYYVGDAPLPTRQLCSLATAGCGNDLTVTFAMPVSDLSLTLDGADGPAAIMSTFITFGDGTTSTLAFTGFAAFVTKTLSFGALSSIKSVTFSTNDPQGMSFDNFRFNEGNAVPEPASWAMMIGGFALAGLALRSRATRIAFA